MHRIISTFMIITCRSRPTMNENHIADHKFIAFIVNVLANWLFGDADAFSSGSYAELYIRPILSCYGDIDIMHYFKTVLAIPKEKAPPTELWDCHQDTVTVYEISDSHKPGYVYLQQSYIARKSENGRYNVQSLRNNGMHTSLLCNSSNIVQKLFGKHKKKRGCNERISNNLIVQMTDLFSNYVGLLDISHFMRCITSRLTSILTNISTNNHGPANSIRWKDLTDFHLNFDYVSCVFCPIWPPQAADWPSRNMHHGWPEQPTINLVVSGGCHVVGAVYPCE